MTANGATAAHFEMDALDILANEAFPRISGA